MSNAGFYTDPFVKLSGFKELDDALKQLPYEMRGRALREALRAGGKVIKDEAVKNAPVYTGLMKKSFLIRLLKVAGYSMTIGVGLHRKWAYYGHMVEFGTKPHEEVSKRLMASEKTGQVFGYKVEHPGIKAEPFLGPAFDTKKEAAVQAIGDVLAKAINRIFKKQTGSEMGTFNPTVGGED
jgi:HK97 gp10 family phage protein